MQHMLHTQHLCLLICNEIKGRAIKLQMCLRCAENTLKSELQQKITYYSPSAHSSFVDQLQVMELQKYY